MNARKYPSYTLAQLEKTVAEGRGNPVMLQEIADRKSGASQVKVTPQIERPGHAKILANNWAKWDAAHGGKK